MRGQPAADESETDNSSSTLGWVWVVPFERLTIANLYAKDNIFWLHALWTYMFVIYALWLLRAHYEVPLPSAAQCRCMCSRLPASGLA